MAPTKEQVLERLAAVKTPDGVPLTDTGTLSDIVVSDGKVFFSITVDASVVQSWEGVRKGAEGAVRAIPGIGSVLVALTAERAGGRGPAAPPPGAAASPGHGAPRAGQAPEGVKSIIAVASGKGGVGKSTTAVNIALGLAAIGLKVGLLDADVYGPSAPRLLAIRGRPARGTRTPLRPMSGYGLAVMSIGFLVEEESPMIWRGPMVGAAVTQMLRDVEWPPLDVMVVDMPPGTGDAQLTLAQQVPLAGAVIVSTPQDLALIDARRGIAMFRRVNVPVLGIVENMSYFLCPHCGTRSDVFAHGGARQEAERLGVPFLGEVPLAMAIRETSDAGRPLVAVDPDGEHARIYREIAARIAAQLQGTAGVRPAPRIVIEA